MMRVRISFTDGCYSMVEVAINEPDLTNVVVISETIWRAYCAHLDASQAWQEHISLLDQKHNYPEE